jgi:high affinity sulfate transporter 1
VRGERPGLERWLPGLVQARSYDRGWLGSDIGAGLVVVALLLPAGMAYAQAAGLPPVTGLYATIVPLLVYAAFGPSRILVLGPDSSLAPLIAAVVVPLAADDPGTAIALGGMLAIVAGLVCLAAGALRLGFVADLLSSPVRFGYLNGIVMTILAGQLADVFGVSIDADSVFGDVRDTVRAVADGETNWWAFGIAVGAFAVIVGARRVGPRLPGALLAMGTAIAAVVMWDLGNRGVALVGELPRGLPTFRVPDPGWSDLGTIVGAAVGIAFVSFTDTSVLARAYAKRSGSPVDADQELIALGAVNIASGFFQGFPVSGSQSRTPVAEQAGARTQLTSVVAAIAILVVVVAIPGVVRNLPEAALAAVVIAAAIKVAEVRPVLRLWRVRRSDFVLTVAALVGVLVFGPVLGVGVAIMLSLLNVLRRSWMPHTAELVRVDGIKGYHDADRHPEGVRVPGLLLYRFDAPLFFANARSFHDDVLERVDAAAAPVRVVVVTAEPVTDIDTTAAEMLDELLIDLAERDVELRFAELKGHVRDRLDDYGMLERFGPLGFARTTGEAVRQYVESTGVRWIDWEDRQA